jgi:hypothetical protein
VKFSRTIDTSTLATADGISSAALTMAAIVCADMLKPVVQATPPGGRQALFEAFLSGLSGAVMAELGDAKAKEVFQKVLEVIAESASEGRTRH